MANRRIDSMRVAMASSSLLPRRLDDDDDDDNNDDGMGDDVNVDVDASMKTNISIAHRRRKDATHDRRMRRRLLRRMLLMPNVGSN